MLDAGIFWLSELNPLVLYVGRPSERIPWRWRLHVVDDPRIALQSKKVYHGIEVWTNHLAPQVNLGSGLFRRSEIPQ